MKQVLIRNVDESLLDDYREAAKLNGRSLEAELREALARARPISGERHRNILDRLVKIRRMTPPTVRQTPAEQIMREVRGAAD
jgi:plasmid stability protein